MARLRGGKSRIELLEGFGSDALQRSYLIQTFLESRRRIVEKSHLGTIRQKLNTGGQTKKNAVNPYLADLSTNLPQYLMDSLLLQSEDSKRAWRENERLLRAIKQYSDNRHAIMVINVFPETLQVNKSHYEFFTKLGFQMDERFLSSSTPQDLMKEFCGQEQILCFDLLPGFKARATEEFYLDLDDHWNGAGYTLAFELVRNELEKHHLIR
jgi:hypothetical protein